MNRHPQHRLRHRDKGYDFATRLVHQVASQWLQGMPLKLARKILRKQGIHPWSLLVQLEGASWGRMIQELDTPRWVVDACLEPCQLPGEEGMEFLELPKDACLPNGLVVPRLHVSHSPHIRRLPKRIWAASIAIRGCEALTVIPIFSSRPRVLDVSLCHRLKTLPAKAGPSHELRLRDCNYLHFVPTLPAHLSQWSEVNLRDLPRLKSMRQGGNVQELFVWNCPSLQGLSGFSVTGGLEVHRCPSLRTLPRFQGEIWGHITDCNGLGDVDLAGTLPGEGSTLKVQPLRGACRLPPVLPLPSLQVVEIKPLLPTSAFEDGPAWVWPPMPDERGDAAIDRTLKILGLSCLERVKCQVRSGRSLSDVVAFSLGNSANPGAALKLLRGLIGEALLKDDRQAFEVLLQQGEAFRIGLVSIWLALPGKQREAMATLLPWWWRDRLSGTSNLEEISEALNGIPGPLIIEDFGTIVGPGLGPRSIEGPLWVGGDFILSDCTEVEKLPELMVVKGDLSIDHCPALRRFPSRIEVHENLTISNLPRLQRSICRTAVGGRLTVVNAPNLQLVPLGSWDQ